MEWKLRIMIGVIQKYHKYKNSHSKTFGSSLVNFYDVGFKAGEMLKMIVENVESGNQEISKSKNH